MPDWNSILKRIIFLKKSEIKHNILILFNFQNEKKLTCMGIV